MKKILTSIVLMISILCFEASEFNLYASTQTIQLVQGWNMIVIN